MRQDTASRRILARPRLLPIYHLYHLSYRVRFTRAQGGSELRYVTPELRPVPRALRKMLVTVGERNVVFTLLFTRPCRGTGEKGGQQPARVGRKICPLCLWKYHVLGSKSQAAPDEPL